MRQGGRITRRSCSDGLPGNAWIAVQLGIAQRETARRRSASPPISNLSRRRTSAPSRSAKPSLRPISSTPSSRRSARSSRLAASIWSLWPRRFIGSITSGSGPKCGGWQSPAPSSARGAMPGYKVPLSCTRRCSIRCWRCWSPSGQTITAFCGAVIEAKRSVSRSSGLRCPPSPPRWTGASWNCSATFEPGPPGYARGPTSRWWLRRPG